MFPDPVTPDPVPCTDLTTPQVNAAITELDEAIEQVQSILTMLEPRLVPVLRRCEKERTAPTATRDIATPLAQAVAHRSTAILDVHCRLLDIFHRLEV